jgi:membrane protease YdiL (CAAX protease family)
MTTNNPAEFNNDKLHRAKIFLLFLACGLVTFVSNAFMPWPYKLIYLAIPAAFLIASLKLRVHDTLKQYYPISFTYGVSSLVFFFTLPFGSGTTVELKVFNILISTLIVVIPLLVVNKLSGKKPGALFLQKGNFNKGIAIGTILFLVFLVTAVPVSIFAFGGRQLSTEKILGLAPWIAAFVCLNAIREELLFRGFFLKTAQTFLRADQSNLVQAIYFSLAHISIPLSPVFLIYLPAAFFLGLGFAAVMQKTDSMLAAFLFHAGSDIPVMLATFSILV